MGAPRGTLMHRLMRNLTLKGNGCWLWNGTCTPYGKLRTERGMEGAHRVSYRLYNGLIPDGYYVLHRCDNPRCVNPDHLFAGTQQENSDDKFAKGRGMVGDRHSNRKINSATAEQIRNLAGTHQRIADRFGISRSQVSRIKSGVNWRTSEDANNRAERKL